MFNKIILVGRLTREVELKYLPSGTGIASFGLATSRKWKDKNSGEDKEETMFIDVNIFGRSGEIANQYLKKGNRVLIEGRLVLDQWEDQNGNKRSRHKVVAESVKFMETKKESEESGKAKETKNISEQEQRALNNKEAIPEIDIDDDDIPF